MPPVTLRRARPSDLRLLLPMVAEAHAPGGLDAARTPPVTGLGQLLEDDSVGGVWLVLEGAAVRGYAALTWSYDLTRASRDAFLAELFVRPEARGRGVGRRALPLLETEARAWGARVLHVVLGEDDHLARRLRCTAGFRAPPRVLLSKALGEAA